MLGSFASYGCPRTLGGRGRRADRICYFRTYIACGYGFWSGQVRASSKRHHTLFTRLNDYFWTYQVIGDQLIMTRIGKWEMGIKSWLQPVSLAHYHLVVSRCNHPFHVMKLLGQRLLQDLSVHVVVLWGLYRCILLLRSPTLTLTWTNWGSTNKYVIHPCWIGCTSDQKATGHAPNHSQEAASRRWH